MKLTRFPYLKQPFLFFLIFLIHLNKNLHLGCMFKVSIFSLINLEVGLIHVSSEGIFNIFS